MPPDFSQGQQQPIYCSKQIICRIYQISGNRKSANGIFKNPRVQSKMDGMTVRVLVSSLLVFLGYLAPASAMLLMRSQEFRYIRIRDDCVSINDICAPCLYDVCIYIFFLSDFNKLYNVIIPNISKIVGLV